MSAKSIEIPSGAMMIDRSGLYRLVEINPGVFGLKPADMPHEILAAVLKERERCAKIAEDFYLTNENNEEALHNEGEYIAKLIRGAK